MGYILGLHRCSWLSQERRVRGLDVGRFVKGRRSGEKRIYVVKPSE